MEAQAFNSPFLLSWPFLRVKSWGKMYLLQEQILLFLSLTLLYENLKNTSFIPDKIIFAVFHIQISDPQGKGLRDTAIVRWWDIFLNTFLNFWKQKREGGEATGNNFCYYFLSSAEQTKAAQISYELRTQGEHSNHTLRAVQYVKIKESSYNPLFMVILGVTYNKIVD